MTHLDPEHPPSHGVGTVETGKVNGFQIFCAIHGETMINHGNGVFECKERKCLTRIKIEFW